MLLVFLSCNNFHILLVLIVLTTRMNIFFKNECHRKNSKSSQFMQDIFVHFVRFIVPLNWFFSNFHREKINSASSFVFKSIKFFSNSNISIFHSSFEENYCKIFKALKTSQKIMLQMINKIDTDSHMCLIHSYK